MIQHGAQLDTLNEKPRQTRCCITDHVRAVAARLPDKPAVVWCTGRDRSSRSVYAQITFAELHREIDRYCHGLTAAGIGRRMRTIVFVKPGVEFFALVFALFKVGAVPVMIDPGIGTRQMRFCLSRINAEAFIGLPRAHVFRKLYPAAFSGVRVAVTVGRRWAWGGKRLADVRAEQDQPYEAAPTAADDPAAILFTSGSTGPAKGVLYTHGVLDAQVGYLHSHFGFSDEEKDLPTFPLFALFDAAVGMTAVIPDMDFTRPGSVDPRRIIEPIHDHGLTHMFGSPALLDRVSRYGQAHGVRLPTIRRVLTAGAPVPRVVLDRMRAMLSDEAEIHTPYGATEALPVASIESGDLPPDGYVATSPAGGTCVGHPLDGLDVRVIPIDDGPIDRWSETTSVAPGVIGEIAVKGPVVTRSYYGDPAATRLAKIADGDTMWHRMGDVGYFDGAGRLWFCGRKSHRVVTERETLFTIPCESVFNRHPAVRRCALVGVGTPGAQRPVLCVELEPNARRANRKKLSEELMALAQANPLTRPIRTLLYHPALPVDVRHNSKIFREKLAEWARRRLR